MNTKIRFRMKKVLNDADADKETLEAAAKDLSDKIMPIGAKMYQQASNDNAGADASDKSSEKSSENSSEKSDDEPVEGEVVS